jgi:hypothetical protein
LNDLSRFEAETPKVAPGDYLQVKVIANVLLPAGGYEPSSFGTPGSAGGSSTSSTSSAESAGTTGTQAVSDLLEAGLL